MTNIDIRPILESSRTTYFDTLQDHRTESGESSDKLKITEVPELNRKKKRRELQKKEGVLQQGLEGECNFLRRKACSR